MITEEITRKIQQIRSLQASYEKISVERENSLEAIKAFHSWFNAVLVLLKDFFPANHEDFVFIKDQDVSGNEYVLKHVYHAIIGRYNMMLDDIEKGTAPLNPSKIKAPQIMHQKQPKIFISHKSEDLPFVKELMRLLEFLIGTDADKIFCSSIAGYDIKPGREILSELKRQFDDYEIYFIVVHSPRYYESSICLNEMGAAWVLGTKFCSFLTSDCKFTMLDGAIDGKYMSVKVDDNYDIVVSKLNSLKDELLEIFSIEKFNQTRWEAYRNEFIRNTQRIDFPSLEKKTAVNIGPKPTAQITSEVINTKPVMIDIMNRGDGIAENLNVRLDDACSDMIITGLDNFPLEYLKPGRHIKLSVYPCISDPDKFKIFFGWEENGIPYSSEDIVIL